MSRLGATRLCGCFDALEGNRACEGGSRTRSGRNLLGWLGQLGSFSSPHASIQMLYPVAVAKCFSRHRFLVFFSPYVSRRFPFFVSLRVLAGRFAQGVSPRFRPRLPFPLPVLLSVECGSCIRWVVAVMIAGGVVCFPHGREEVV